MKIQAVKTSDIHGGRLHHRFYFIFMNTNGERNDTKCMAIDKVPLEKRDNEEARAKKSGPFKRKIVSVKGDLLRAADRRVRKIGSSGRRTCGFLKALIWDLVVRGESVAITDRACHRLRCELVTGVFYSPPD